MTIYLKQSTASQEVLLGPFLDDTDGKTAETALSIANTDIKIWKTGATTEASKNSGGATHIASGRYYTVLDATDTNTLGPMEINVHVSGALPVRRECCVLAANIYDSLIGGGDLLDVSAVQVEGGDATDAIQTAAAAALTAYDPPTNAEMEARTLVAANYATASALATVDTEIGVIDGIVDAILLDTAEIGAAGAGLTALASAANLATVAGYLDTEIAAILEDTGTTLPAQIAALNNLSAAEVAAELATYDGPTNAEMTAAFTQIKGTTWATTDTLEAIRDRGDAAWATATGFSTLDAAGVRTAIGLASANLDTQLDALPTAVEVRAEVDSNSTQLAAILADTAEIGTAGAGLTALATAAALTTVDSNVDAIKAKTDSLAFTVAGQVDANIQYVNDVQVTGTGASGDEWGP